MSDSIRITTRVLALFCVVMAGSWTTGLAQQPIDNSTVRISVEYKLVRAGILKNDNIRVAVADSTVKLEGTVPTLHDMREAEKLARGVEDAYRVLNALKLSSPSVPEKQLADEVTKAIDDHVFYSIFDWVDVNASNGIVTLKGWVHLPWYAREYVSQAERVPGVKQVVNDLKDATGSEYLMYRSARLIYDDPFFTGYAFERNPPVHIIVNLNTVILEGKVGSENLRAFAADQIRFHTDAFNVVNNLKVGT